MYKENNDWLEFHAKRVADKPAGTYATSVTGRSVALGETRGTSTKFWKIGLKR